MRKLSKEHVLDNIAGIAGGTVGFLNSSKEKIKEEIKQRIDEKIMQMDLVPRQDFESLETLVKTLREDQLKMRAELDSLQKNAGKTTGKAGTKKTSAKKPSSPAKTATNKKINAKKGS